MADFEVIGASAFKVISCDSCKKLQSKLKAQQELIDDAYEIIKHAQWHCEHDGAEWMRRAKLEER